MTLQVVHLPPTRPLQLPVGWLLDTRLQAKLAVCPNSKQVPHNPPPPPPLGGGNFLGGPKQPSSGGCKIGSMGGRGKGRGRG